MTETINTLIIGGGQAGLALSYLLLQKGHPHLIIEQAAQPAEAWRKQRWDSFTFVTPNWSIQMPGGEYDGPDPDGFLPRDEIVAYFENYVRRHNLPIRYNVRATGLGKTDDTFRVETTTDTFEAKNVVIATGLFQKPKLPAFSKNIAPSIRQLHSGEYRNSAALAPGAVLVIGSGQSGCQIAEELYQSGRKVFMSTGKAPRVPRRYRGKDIVAWLDLIGFLSVTADQLPSPRAKFAANPQATGKDGGHDINLHQFVRDGVNLFGHIRDASETRVFFAPDLYENLKSNDNSEREIVKMIDDYIIRTGLTVSPETHLEPLTDGYQVPLATELDLGAHNITTIIWSNGYTFDFSWLSFPIFDQDGYPVQTRGVTAVRGLYFLGLHFLHNRKSATLLGIGEDATYLAEQMEKS